MNTPAQADMQRWSDEVARDPRSLAFLPLARAYRKQGLRDLSLQLCLRGLEAYPAHVEGHGLLAMLYLDAGDHERAADEWSMVLRVDPDNFEALRGMGFCFLEQDRLSRARQMLERAALLRPSDQTVQEALRVLGTRQEIAEKGLSSSPDVAFGDDPWATSESGPIFMFAPSASPDAEATERTGSETVAKHLTGSGIAEDGERVGGSREVVAGGRGAAGESQSPRPTRAVPVTGPLPIDPTLLFDDLLGAGPLLGAILVDVNGLILAGRLTEAVRGDPAVLGAVLGGAIGEATRTALHLALGTWRGILLDAEHAMLHLAPAGPDSVMVLAARKNAPAGWVLRASTHAITQAQQYMEEYA